MIPAAIPLRDGRLFQMAMCHRSGAADSVKDSYERLEFFGDSVLGMIIAQYLYEHHPTWDQGMLSKARSSVVQEGPLAETALRLKLDEHLILSPGEESAGGRKRDSILADVFEAVVGGIYLESGLETTRWFVLEQLDRYLKIVSGGDVNPNDYKSKLQETAQLLWRRTPVYKIVMEAGMAHNRKFKVQVLFDSEVMGEGEGRSKKEAEQSAAQDALELIERDQRARAMAREEAF